MHVVTALERQGQEDCMFEPHLGSVMNLMGEYGERGGTRLGLRWKTEQILIYNG